ncbi:hypothetical protein KN1_14340 [Stygiolobus caldivivus]|uniref:Uncharacterized protein n=1 Tax=Stygiolobus caldivivus TaxID=2824673 RepID=A0A8D5U6H2_9CREN|nr:hypothetical protein KN1_14340 [Stygiolobus caldivivus]
MTKFLCSPDELNELVENVTANTMINIVNFP